MIDHIVLTPLATTGKKAAGSVSRIVQASGQKQHREEPY